MTVYAFNGLTVAAPDGVGTNIHAGHFIMNGNRICMYSASDNHEISALYSDNLYFFVDGNNVGSLSDQRLKSDIKLVEDELYKIIEDIEIKEFKLINKNGKISVGIIAQDLIKAFEKTKLNIEDYTFISKSKYNLEDEQEYYIVNYEQFLILHNKFLQKKIENIEKQVSYLVNKIQEMEGKNE